MCGIAGFVGPMSDREHHARWIDVMLGAIVHRGPDDDGRWFDLERGVALGHRRLSIQDLSLAGHQPMLSACGRFVMTYNGEIYNHFELRNRLEAEGNLPIGGWRGHSDTETLMACFVAWGIEKSLQQAVGMFALVVWDAEQMGLYLARDRTGEKPLYYGWHNGLFLFGSELKALRAHPNFRGEIDWHAASSYLRRNYVPAPSTIFQGIFKLLPGTILSLSQDDLKKGIVRDAQPYWSLTDAARRGEFSPFKGSFEDAVNELDTLVRESVRLQSIGDVPVGAFLSGGIDSSLIVAMMQNQASSDVITFSVGMSGDALDESRHAEAVAKHLGTRHIEHMLAPKEVLDLIPRLNEIWDEPFADSSQIPTLVVSQLARQRVTVALTGDGGDEFFLGYTQYPFFEKVWRSRVLGRLPWNAGFAFAEALGSIGIPPSTVVRARSLVGAWRQGSPGDLNHSWSDSYRAQPVPIREQASAGVLRFPFVSGAATSAALWDAGTYLPDDILVKVDRAGMAYSLETRAPLLDHRIIEFAYHLPQEYKLSGQTGKRVLRELLYRYVPRSLVDRPKAGFSIPLASWLRSELSPWGEHVIDSIAHDDDNFDKPMIEELWNDHKSGAKDHAQRLWAVLNLRSFIAGYEGRAC